MTAAELEKPVLINLRVTVAWRDFAHDQARKHGMTLTAYIKTLIELAAKTDTPNG